MSVSRFSSPSRRAFLQGSVATALTFSANLPARAATGDTVKIGLISPQTGPLAIFGSSDKFIIDHLYAQSAGIKRDGTTRPFEILHRDSGSDPVQTAKATQELIDAGVHMIVAHSTPQTTNPVADTCEAAGVPCLTSIAPWEAWYFGRGAQPGAPSPFKWSFHWSFGMAEFATMYAASWNRLESNRKFTLLVSNDPDGDAFDKILAPQIAEKGYTHVNTVRYDIGTTDFSSQIDEIAASDGEILLIVAITPDFHAFWSQFSESPAKSQFKIAHVAKAMLFPEETGPLGDKAVTVSTGLYWHKSFPFRSLATGVSSFALAMTYEAVTKQQWTQQTGAVLATIDGAFAALSSAASLAPEDIRAAMADLDVTTLCGPMSFRKGPVPNVAVAPVLGGQWIKSPEPSFPYDLAVTDNTSLPSVPVDMALMPLG